MPSNAPLQSKSNNRWYLFFLRMVSFIVETHTHAYNEFFFALQLQSVDGTTHFIWLKSVLSTFRKHKQQQWWPQNKNTDSLNNLQSALEWFMRCILSTFNETTTKNNLFFWNASKIKCVHTHKHIRNEPNMKCLCQRMHLFRHLFHHRTI